MSNDLSTLIETFEEVGIPRGSMNGASLGVVSDPDGGFRVNCGTGSVLEGLRRYEARKGTARSYRDQFHRLIRADVSEARAKRRLVSAS